MDWDRIEGNWQQFKGLAKHKWGMISQDELDGVDGKHIEQTNRLLESYGMAKDGAKEEISV